MHIPNPTRISPSPPHIQLRPTYFLVRPSGLIVPLIAADELPPNLVLSAVPRAISLEETVGMLNLGLQKGSGGFYAIAENADRGAGDDKVVKTFDQFPKDKGDVGVGADVGLTDEAVSAAPTNSTGQADLAKDNSHVPSVPQPRASTPPPTLPTHDHSHDHEALRTSTHPHSPQTQAHSVNNPNTHTHNANTNTNTHNHNHTHTHTHTSAPSPPNTQLCRHWCQHGICKWGPQCRYKHTMPMSASLLRDVGMSDWPLWFRELNPGYFVAETRSAARLQSHLLHQPHAQNQNQNQNRGTRRLGTRSQQCCSHQVPPPAEAGVGGRGDAGGKADRLRPGTRIPVKDRTTGRILPTSELGEQIILRLKNMEAQAQAEKEKKKMAGNVVMERAQARDTRRWEDESESGSDAAEAGDGDEGEGEGEVGLTVQKERKLVEV